MVAMAEEALLTVKEVASRLRVDEETVRRWLRTGRMRGIRPGGARADYRIPDSELRRMLTGLPPAD
jgi:excisionase family DNA binding protein